VLSVVDALLFRVLYACKYLTVEQAYFGLFLTTGIKWKSFDNRIRKLSDAGWIKSVRVQLNIGEYEEISLPGSTESCELPEAGAKGDRRQFPRVMFLGERGEAWCARNIPSYVASRHPVIASARENWAHELVGARLLLETLDGTPADQSFFLQESQWLTPYRGTSLVRKFADPAAIKIITPDIALTLFDQKRHLFVEVDRGTKRLFNTKYNAKGTNTILATLQAYNGFIRFEYDKVYPDYAQPYVLYVVPNEKRKQEIEKLVRDRIHDTKVVVRRLDDGARWIKGFLAGRNLPSSAVPQTSTPSISELWKEQTAALSQKLEATTAKLTEAQAIIQRASDQLLAAEERADVWKTLGLRFLQSAASSDRKGFARIPAEYYSLLKTGGRP
jgi:hypothetical protein